MSRQVQDSKDRHQERVPSGALDQYIKHCLQRDATSCCCKQSALVGLTMLLPDSIRNETRVDCTLSGIEGIAEAKKECSVPVEIVSSFTCHWVARDRVPRVSLQANSKHTSAANIEVPTNA